MKTLWLAVDVAKEAGVSRQRAYQWDAAGQLPDPAAVTPGGSRLWEPADILAWLAKREAAGR